MARKYIGGYWHTVVEHYELNADHLMSTKGYESYGGLQARVREEGGLDAMVEFFMGLQIWGTPEQCFEKIMTIQKRIGSNTFNGVFSYAGMPLEEETRRPSVFEFWSRARPGGRSQAGAGAGHRARP